MTMRNSVVRMFAAGAMLAAAAMLVGTAPADAAPAVPASGAPVPTDCHLIDFDHASLSPVMDPSVGDGPAAARYGIGVHPMLVVQGVNPSSGVTVSLRPVTYLQQPDYWIIEVIGCGPEISLPVLTPYTAKLDLTGVTGKQGVEVIGARTSRQLPVYPVPGPLSVP